MLLSHEAADWQAFRRRLVVWLASRVRDPSDAEDLTQEILVRAASRLDTLRDRERLVPWLDAMARNALVDYYRRNGRAPETVPLDPAVADTTADAPPDRHHLTGCLLPLLDSLPPSYREAVRRVDLDGERQVDVALDLGLNISALKSRVQRGRSMLRDRFADCCGAVERDAAGRVVGFQEGATGKPHTLVQMQRRRPIR
ncbi:MAG: sigma-70 family RNA polymerase sigma factor [Gemmatimonadales bacterium]